MVNMQHIQAQILPINAAGLPPINTLGLPSTMGLGGWNLGGPGCRVTKSPMVAAGLPMINTFGTSGAMFIPINVLGVPKVTAGGMDISWL